MENSRETSRKIPRILARTTEPSQSSPIKHLMNASFMHTESVFLVLSRVTLIIK